LESRKIVHEFADSPIEGDSIAYDFYPTI
jgi:hypothetical protein